MTDDPPQQIHLRLPKDLHAQLQDAATERGVSMNTVVIETLAGIFPPVSARRATASGRSRSTSRTS